MIKLYKSIWKGFLMKKIFFVSLTILGILAETTGFSAPVSRRTTRNTASSTNGAAPQTTAARSAVSARSARGTAPVATTANKTSGTRTMGARSATPTKTTPTVAARAATTQKVIGTGSKVTTAAKNVLINEECQAKYDGCMDAFCMIDNANDDIFTAIELFD